MSKTRRRRKDLVAPGPIPVLTAASEMAAHSRHLGRRNEAGYDISDDAPEKQENVLRGYIKRGLDPFMFIPPFDTHFYPTLRVAHKTL